MVEKKNGSKIAVCLLFKKNNRTDLICNFWLLDLHKQSILTTIKMRVIPNQIDQKKWKDGQPISDFYET